MNILFSEITELQPYVGGAINVSIDMRSITPTIERATYDYILPIIGQTQYDELLGNLSSTDARIVNLLEAVRRPLALLTVYEHSFVGDISFGESGLYRTETDDRKGAYKYQVNTFRAKHLNQGYNSIERLILFLDANLADYPLFTAATEYARHRSLVINYASEFAVHYDMKINRYIYQIMRPVIEEMEIFVLEPLLGQDFYTEIKTKIKANTLDAQEKQLLFYLQKSVAHYTVLESLKRNIVQFQGDRIAQVEELEPQSSRKTSNAGMNSIGVLAGHNEEFAARHLSKAKWYLTENIDNFPTYKAWKEALAAAVEEAAATVEDNSRYSACGRCYGNCNCTTTTKKTKKIFRF